MTEAEIQHAILKRWGAHPRVRLWRSNSGRAWVETSGGGFRPMQVNVSGIGDLTGWVTIDDRAVFLSIECKSLTGRQRESQKAFQRVLESMGGIYIIARSVEDVDAVLEPLLI